MNNDLLYQLSLADVPFIGPVQAKILCDHFGSAGEIFNAGMGLLQKVEGIGEIRARSIKRFRDFRQAEKEMLFIEKYGIIPLFLTNPLYPKRLLNCFDPPSLLFFKGRADLSAPKIISVVGTRNLSEYGRTITERLIKELAPLGITVVSGLAFGIDAIAHKTALRFNTPTIGVIGHGLDTIYPPENTGLARTMLANGGLLTEFRSRTKPDKHNFPRRNRIVAGISDATIIIESGVKGGSMITAEIAFGYHRDVFAFPGRATDSRSAGCNQLIRQNKASLLTDPSQLIEYMGWSKTPGKPLQQRLFPELGDVEKRIIELLENNETVGIEQLNMLAGVRGSSLASALLTLEMHNIARSLPGKRYRLCEESI